MLVLLAAVVTGAVAQETYKVSVKEGTEDASNWTITPAEATTTGVAAGTEVKATYNGTKKVKSVKAKKKAAAVRTAAEATAEDIGKLNGADGNIYHDAAAATAASTTAVAKIVYVGSDNGEDAPYNHGLALALSDANDGNDCEWGPYNSDAGHTKQTSSTFTEESGLQYNATHNSDTYPAFKAAIANNGTAAPTGCSSWFLASGYQWKKMIGAAGLSDLGLEEYTRYWSSTERNDKSAFYFNSNTGGWSTFNKDNLYYVRACLAF